MNNKSRNQVQDVRFGKLPDNTLSVTFSTESSEIELIFTLEDARSYGLQLVLSAQILSSGRSPADLDLNDPNFYEVEFAKLASTLPRFPLG